MKMRYSIILSWSRESSVEMQRKAKAFAATYGEASEAVTEFIEAAKANDELIKALEAKTSEAKSNVLKEAAQMSRGYGRQKAFAIENKKKLNGELKKAKAIAKADDTEANKVKVADLEESYERICTIIDGIDRRMQQVEETLQVKLDELDKAGVTSTKDIRLKKAIDGLNDKAAEILQREELRVAKASKEIEDVKLDVIELQIGKKPMMVSQFGDTIIGRRTVNTKGDAPVVLRVYHDDEHPCAESYNVFDNEYVICGASNGGIKGSGEERFSDGIADMNVVGVAIGIRKDVLEANPELKPVMPFVKVLTENAINDGVKTVEEAEAMLREAEILLAEATKRKDAAQVNLIKCNEAYNKNIAATVEAHKAAMDAIEKAENERSLCEKLVDAYKGYVVRKANPACPKWTAAKVAQKTSFGTVGCDEIALTWGENVAIMKQEDIREAIADITGKPVMEMKADGTMSEGLYHYTGDDGACYVPFKLIVEACHKMYCDKNGKEPTDNEMKSMIIKYVDGQFRDSGRHTKGYYIAVEYLKKAEVTAENIADFYDINDIDVGDLLLSADHTHWVCVIENNEIVIKDKDGNDIMFDPKKTIMMNESCVKDSALDAKAEWRKDVPNVCVMQADTSVGTVRLARQSMQILTQMTKDEAAEIAKITIGKAALTNNLYFAGEKVADQISAFKQKALAYMRYCGASQRQLNKTIWSVVNRLGEGRVEVEGAMLFAHSDTAYNHNVQLCGKTREDAGFVKPGHCLVPVSTGLEIGDKIWVVRYPLTNPVPVVLTVQGYCPEGHVEFSSMRGETIMQDLAMDYDGDHVYIVWNKACVNAAIRTREWIKSFTEFEHFSVEDIPAEDWIKRLTPAEYSNAARGLGDVGKKTAPLFVLYSVLKNGMDPDERIEMPNGSETTPREIITLCFWICVYVTWAADASKRGSDVDMSKTEVGRRITELTKKTFAPSQPFARPYEHNRFGMMRSAYDHLANRFEVLNYDCVTEMIREHAMRTLTAIGNPQCEEMEFEDTVYTSYNSVMYGSYGRSERGTYLNYGFVARLCEGWNEIFDRAEAADVNLNNRWFVPMCDNEDINKEEVLLLKPISSAVIHSGYKKSESANDFMKRFEALVGSEFNWEPGWTVVSDGEGHVANRRKSGLDISLFIARMERKLSRKFADNDGGTKKREAKESAYDFARALIRDWAYNKHNIELTDRQVDIKLYDELAYALVAFRGESTNMGASLMEWANTFSNDEEVVDGVTGKKYKRNFLTASAKKWWAKHEAGYCDDGSYNKTQAELEMHVTDLQFFKRDHKSPEEKFEDFIKWSRDNLDHLKVYENDAEEEDIKDWIEI